MLLKVFVWCVFSLSVTSFIYRIYYILIFEILFIKNSLYVRFHHFEDLSVCPFFFPLVWLIVYKYLSVCIIFCSSLSIICQLLLSNGQFVLVPCYIFLSSIFVLKPLETFSQLHIITGSQQYIEEAGRGSVSQGPGSGTV